MLALHYLTTDAPPSGLEIQITEYDPDLYA